MEKRFFIFDCNDNLAGNPKGYRTMRGAIQQADSRFSRVHRELWDRHNAWHDRNPSHNLVYSIRHKDS